MKFTKVITIQSTLKLCLFLVPVSLFGGESQRFDTDWIPSKPEVLTYRSTAKQGDGLYQVSVARTEAGIDLYMNIITPGFTKSVWGSMTAQMHPRESKSRIIVNDQVSMTSDCAYDADRLHIKTVMAPYNRVMDNTLSSSNLVVDFSQGPLLARTLPLRPGAVFKFDSLNPQNNSIVPLSLRVMGEATVQKIDCYRVEGSDFEGQATYWIEKAGHHRVLRIEQPATGRVTELIQ